MFVCGSVDGLVFVWLRGHNWGRRGNIFSDRVAKYGNNFIFSIISAMHVNCQKYVLQEHRTHN